MSKNPSPAKSTAKGELSLDDLEKIAGGTVQPTETLTSKLASENGTMSITEQTRLAEKSVLVIDYSQHDSDRA